MRRLARAVPVLAVVALAACGTSPCQELGQRICKCQPGLSADACKTQVEKLLKDSKPSDAQCEGWLNSCEVPASSPPGTDLCEWMLTKAGKDACGLTPPP